MPPPSDIVKVAIEWPGANAQLTEIDQGRRTLHAVIRVLFGKARVYFNVILFVFFCSWSLSGSEQFALRYADGPQLYITELSRSEIKNGTILRLAISPGRAARQLLERVQSHGIDARLEALKELAKLSADITFATEFINMEGITVLARLVESGTNFGEMLAFTLTAFLELMDHGIVSWELLSLPFIKQVSGVHTGLCCWEGKVPITFLLGSHRIAGYVNQPMVDVSILQRSLAILESMVLNSQSLYQRVAHEITVGQLIGHLQVELRERIQPEILELIKQQRFNRLCEGSCFRKIGNRRRQEKFWFCRLSLNHKVLHYGDLEEPPQGEVPFESLTDKSECEGGASQAATWGRAASPLLFTFLNPAAAHCLTEVMELAFSVLHDPDEALNFVAPNKYEYCIWTDGLSALIGREMGSELTRSDLDTLLSMEMKLRLLDLENIQIPEAPPPIPKEPSSYNFVYHYG
ncbi:UNVERIFIED_CONTAM: hypothetical protein FKN15_064401 [Acipenser sinensis]